MRRMHTTLSSLTPTARAPRRPPKQSMPAQTPPPLALPRSLPTPHGLCVPAAGWTRAKTHDATYSIHELHLCYIQNERPQALATAGGRRHLHEYEPHRQSMSDCHHNVDGAPARPAAQLRAARQHRRVPPLPDSVVDVRPMNIAGGGSHEDGWSNLTQTRPKGSGTRTGRQPADHAAATQSRTAVCSQTPAPGCVGRYSTAPRGMPRGTIRGLGRSGACAGRGRRKRAHRRPRRPPPECALPPPAPAVTRARSARSGCPPCGGEACGQRWLETRRAAPG
eukprot:scaffold22274_cov145-Isochrysis_galbana.AAC.1